MSSRRSGTNSSRGDHGSTTAGSTSYSTESYQVYTTTTSRPRTSRRTTGRSQTARPQTGLSTLAGIDSQQIICAVSESRGLSPTVGLAFVNLDTCEAVLCQMCDSQTYVRTLHKIHVFGPSEILIVSTASNPKSKLFSIIEESLLELDSSITLLDRRYWSETAGLEYVQQLAFSEDVEAIKIAISGNYFAVCCLAAALKYVEHGLNKTFPFHSLRIKYEPSEGSMMIDVSTIYSMELIQNLQDPRSRDCLFGVLNQTQTPMGSRLLRSNILQPLTNSETLNLRYDAVEEMTTKEDVFFGIRPALKNFVDVDKLLTSLIVIPTTMSLQDTEQNINNVIMLREYILLVQPIYEALTSARSPLLTEIRELCAPIKVNTVKYLIDSVINEDVRYSKLPLALRYQRTFAVKSGVNGLLDVSRTTFKENSDDALAYVSALAEESGLSLELKYDSARQYYIRLPKTELLERALPEDFINVVKRKSMIECSTLSLVKRNQKILDSHNECLLLSDRIVHDLISQIRDHISVLFKICEGVAMLDMISAFAQLAINQDYVRPQLSKTLAIKSGRHPIREVIHSTKFIPNDVYATQQTRFQIITGCNMSGKSTYIRSVALMAVMAQIGSFVPAQFASFPIHHQLFARVSFDDSIEVNTSTFAVEMQETAFILHNIDKHSIAIVDELGRGTSTRDGLAIAIAIAEALVESRALVWFATHFVDLARILAERNGVINLHLVVEMPDPSTMTMLYKIAPGAVKEEHYGLALAKIVPLPPDVLEHATLVAEKLDSKLAERRKSSTAVILQRRRRLILNLKEHLVQARDGVMQGAALTAWLKELQKEFVLAMSALDVAARGTETEQDEDMSVDQAQSSAGEVERLPGSGAERPVTVSSEFASS